MTQFSVIIPTYNRLGLLKAALASVWDQTLTDYEVIVVDDGSTDCTREWLATQSGRLRFIWQENSGPSTARNIGAAAARGRYLAFLDSDDVWFPWSLDTYATQIAHYGDPAILCASLMLFHDQAELSRIRQEAVRSDAFTDYLASHRKGYFVGAGMSVLRRDVFLAAGGFDISFMNCEDHDLILRLGVAEGFVKVLSPTTVAYRRYAGTMTTVDLTLGGALMLVERERAGTYPGGSARAPQRQAIIARHVRSAAIACGREGRISDAGRAYATVAGWHVRLRQWKFLIGFPTFTLISTLFGWASRRRSNEVR